MRYDPCLHIVLHEPEIPPNAGNVGRTCVAIGAKMWLVRPLGFQIDDYYLRRAGLDYWDDLEWAVADSWPDLVERLAAAGIDALLVGESLLVQPDPGRAAAALLGA